MGNLKCKNIKKIYNKKEVLKCFGANIFFDDQEIYAAPASEVVPSARVPYKKGENE